ncbi:tripartite motif-containing protein 16-like [Pangasianodon hypophthalmus]|uniref:tripartite motif-containing protein 16-like n=1 Tax=Pangasianodon hypophthalmus TaxID=310915 RepID=UPI00230717FF|nr:tripartite motif-containing protein 16-like [Pangasianodon hypophthalmus]
MHKIIETSTKQEKIFSQHDRLMEVYHLNDQTCMCYLCTMDNHRGHDIVIAERNEKQAFASGRQSPQLIRPKFNPCDIFDLNGLSHSLPKILPRPGNFLEEEFNTNSCCASSGHMSPPPELQSREYFMKYFQYLTLDPNTAHRNLILSETNRTVRYSMSEQQYSDHPERFDYWLQVLSEDSVCGRSYWEVEWSGVGGVFISLSYKDIHRKGPDNASGFGRNNQSWSLWCTTSSLSFFHNYIETKLRVPASSRIGVYVDHSAGTLSFCSVSDTMKLLHRVHTTFTQPLYAGFGLYSRPDSIVRLFDPE